MNDFELLDVPVGATKEQISAAYRLKALQHHPDRGGDSEFFKKVVVAYENLIKMSLCGECGGKGRKTIVLSPFVIDMVCAQCDGKGNMSITPATRAGACST